MPVTSKAKGRRSLAFHSLFVPDRYEMSTVDAIDLARRAIVHAAHRDAASGNIVRSMSIAWHEIPMPSFLFFAVYHMKETGWEKIEEKDTNDYMYQYLADKTMNL